MKRVNPVYALVYMSLMLLGISACSLLEAEGESKDVVDTTWRLVSFEIGEEKITPPEDKPFAMGFGANGKLGIRIDCNVGTGTYEAGADGSIQLDDVVQTYSGCGTDIYDREFGQGLHGIDTYTINTDTLVLTSSTDTDATFTFERVYTDQ